MVPDLRETFKFELQVNESNSLGHAQYPSAELKQARCARLLSAQSQTPLQPTQTTSKMPPVEVKYTKLFIGNEWVDAVSRKKVRGCCCHRPTVVGALGRRSHVLQQPVGPHAGARCAPSKSNKR